MNIIEVDVDGQATKLASAAQLALEDGDLSRAQQLFRDAGNLLNSKVAAVAKPSEKDFCRYLAATQFYNGGLYAEAVKICDKIDLSRLPHRLRSSFSSFRKSVKERSTAGYKKNMLEQLTSEYRDALANNKKSAFEKVIEILKEICFLLPADQVAFIRGRCSAGMGLSRAASLFHRKAYLLNKHNANYRTIYFDSLFKDGRLDEARRLIAEEMSKGEDFNSIIDCLIMNNRQATIAALSHEEYLQLCRDTINMFEKAWTKFAAHSAKNQIALRSRMNFACALALIAFDAIGDVEGKTKLLNSWVEFDPGKAQIVLRGLHTYPNSQAIDDFRRVIRSGTEDLGREKSWPYVFLAHHGYVSHRYPDCIEFARKALDNDPTPQPMSFVLEMLASAQKESGVFDRSDLVGWLRRAAEVESSIGEEQLQFRGDIDVETYLDSPVFRTRLTTERLSNRFRPLITQYEAEVRDRFSQETLDIQLVT